MNVKDSLHKAVDLLDEDDADTMLNFIMRFVVSDDIASEDEIRAIKRGRENYKKGNCTSLSEYDAQRKASV